MFYSVIKTAYTAMLCAACGVLSAAGSVNARTTDAMRGPSLRDVRLGGRPAEKMNAFFGARMLSKHAQRDVFGEARRAFERRDDDAKGHGGLWRGEFWGKLMLGTARVADYLQDPSLLSFVREECHRLMELQDDDGYLDPDAGLRLPKRWGRSERLRFRFFLNLVLNFSRGMG